MVNEFWDFKGAGLLELFQTLIFNFEPLKKMGSKLEHLTKIKILEMVKRNLSLYIWRPKFVWQNDWSMNSWTPREVD